MVDHFEAHRPLLFSIAYRMLGSAMEAEDMVQETYLRYQAIPDESIRSLKAFLSTIITRLCLDHLKSAQAQREVYIGPWLPEPIATNQANPEIIMGSHDTISMAFLVLLESLSPAERAVFILREVFDYDYAEIGAILNKEEAACRQLFSRAKKHLVANHPRFEASPDAHQEILNRFVAACTAGDLDGLTTLLAENVVLRSDTGGKVKGAARHPIYGTDAVGRFLVGITRLQRVPFTLHQQEINGQAALVVRRLDRSTLATLSLDIVEEQVQAVYMVGNPDKLQRI